MNSTGVSCSWIQIELFSKSYEKYAFKAKKNQVCQAVYKAQFILVSEDCWSEVSGVTSVFYYSTGTRREKV